MKPRILFITTVLTGLAMVAPINMSAKDKKTPSANPSPTASPQAGTATKKTRAYPYHGKVASVDISAQTFMIGKRTFTITGETKITKDGAARPSSDIMTGEMVGGSYWKKDDGTMEARTVKIGTKSTEAAVFGDDRQKKK